MAKQKNHTVKVKQLINGVMTDIFNDDDININKFKKFLSVQDNLKPPSNELTSLLDEYDRKLKFVLPTLKKMVDIEEKILQYRIMENLKVEDIKLNLVRQYIYARTHFYRIGNRAKDIRIIVGTTDVYGPFETIINDPKFLGKVKDDLSSAMLKVILDQ
jgi:hypothetical protein